MIWIGIDTGTHTGVAVWDSREKAFLSLETMAIHRALAKVKELASSHPDDITVVFEDARQRKWYSGDASAKMQGAGSVKRDASIWEDFLTDMHIPFQAVAPHKGMTKMREDYFKRLTGWGGRTSDHARDAALLVFAR